MHPDLRYVLTIIGWSVFWALLVLGIAALIGEWQILDRIPRGAQTPSGTPEGRAPAGASQWCSTSYSTPTAAARLPSSAARRWTGDHRASPLSRRASSASLSALAVVSTVARSASAESTRRCIPMFRDARLRPTSISVPDRKSVGNAKSVDLW